MRNGTDEEGTLLAILLNLTNNALTITFIKFFNKQSAPPLAGAANL